MSTNPKDYYTDCPICSSHNLEIVYKFRDFKVIKCKDCENAWRSNMYDEKKIEEIYCIDHYEENPYFSYNLDSVEHFSNNRFKNYKKALDYLKKHQSGGKLLDIGCGTGTFLSLAKKYGWELNGVEISPDISNVCKQNVPEARIYTGRFEDICLESEQFDLITMWDVIEHVINPVEVICRIKSLLKDGGIALFCTPDEDSLLAKVGKSLYYTNISYPALALRPPNHTYFFSRKGFKHLINKLNMQVVTAYSQDAFFEHSEMASNIQKLGISVIEKLGGLFDTKYEMVVMVQK